MEKYDVRMLQLCKQHYKDQYTEPKEFQYSCWGYYDGVNVFEAKGRKSQLFQKRSNAPVSQMWYGMDERTGEGDCSIQEIGIFREVTCEEDLKEQEDFWRSANGLPFFAMGFLRIRDPKDHKRVQMEIEDLRREETSFQVKITVYYTFDNADLVFFVKSNRLKEINEVLERTKEKPYVRYIHSLMGVAESYLNLCDKEGMRTTRNGREYFLDDKISSFTMKIVSSGEQDIIQEILQELRDKEISGEIRCGNTEGHEDLSVQIIHTFVKDILKLMLPKSLCNHTFPVYGSKIYNIETSICIKETILSNEELNTGKRKKKKKKDRSRDSLGAKNTPLLIWSKKLLDTYREKRELAWKKNDESLYSYYNAMIRTVNTLAQYEASSLAGDIFELIFPAFHMFDERLSKALEGEKPNNYAIKDSICKFLQTVDSVIYHTVHTDQIFLMAPGYSGTSYSIPIKLCLFYLGIADYLIRILNDRGNYKYVCFITPEMEFRPMTELIHMGQDEPDRLICFHAPQRALYIPRHFLVILTHEVAHYVGNQIRCRKVRARCVVQILACFISEAIFVGDFGKDIKGKKGIYDVIYTEIKADLQKKCFDFLGDKVREADPTREYHATRMKDVLKAGCTELLVNEDGPLYQALFRVPDELAAYLEGEENLEYYEIISSIQKHMNRNRMELLTSEKMKELVDEVFQVYREIFSDIAAVSILECDFRTFEESFSVSEGVLLNVNSSDRKMEEIRRYMVSQILDKKKDTGEAEKKKEEKEEEIPSCTAESMKKLYEDRYTFLWMEHNLMKYVEHCQGMIRNQITDPSVRKQLCKVREYYDMFCNTQAGSMEIYDKVLECIDEYKQNVKGEREKFCS